MNINSERCMINSFSSSNDAAVVGIIESDSRPKSYGPSTSTGLWSGDTGFSVNSKIYPASLCVVKTQSISFLQPNTKLNHLFI